MEKDKNIENEIDWKIIDQLQKTQTNLQSIKRQKHEKRKKTKD